jgi:aminoglycoside 2''-phosphotransferase
MDEEKLIRSLERAFPDLQNIEPLQVVGSGFSSDAVRTAGGVVFRIAKNAVAGARHRREQALLRLLRPYISGFSIPFPTYYRPQAEGFPFGVVGYASLAGRPMRPQDVTPATRNGLAASIATFIRQLRDAPMTGTLHALRPPRFPPPEPELVQMWQQVRPYLRQAFDSTTFATLERWWADALRAWRAPAYRAVLLHGDLWYENILLDSEGKQVVGVLDFENFSLGDPATDFTTQLYVGEDFAEAVLSAYRRLGGREEVQGAEGRMRRLLGLRELQGLAYGVATGSIDPDTYDKIRAATSG